MSKSKELAKNTIILFIGVFFTKVIQYFLLPVYTGYLSTNEYGTVDLFNTIISLLTPIIGLQIEHGIFRFLIMKRSDKDKQKEFISSSFFFLLFSSILSLMVISICFIFISNKYKWLVLLNLYLTLLSSYIMQVSRGLGNNKIYSISSITISITTVLFNILFLVEIGLKVDGMLYGSALGYFSGIILLFTKLKLYKYISIKKISKEALKEMLKYSFPMIPNSISWWIFSSSDRFVITYFIGLSATGLLSLAYKFSNIGIVIYNVFNMSLTESIALHIYDNDIEIYFNNVFNKVSSIFTSISAILIAFMPIIFELLINYSYNEAYKLIPLAIIATLFQVYSMNFGTIYVAKNNTKSVAITSIVAAIINIAVDLMLVKFIGVYAAVISTIISYLVLFIYRYVDVNKKYMKVVLNKSLLLNISLTIFIISVLYYIDNIYIALFNIIISIIIAYIFNKNNVKVVIKTIKKKLYKNNYSSL